MAQAKTIEEAVDKLMKDYRNAAFKAAKYATKQVMKDFTDKTYSELKTYYDSYKPRRYRRQYFLAKCIVPFSNITTNGRTLKCVMHIDFDSTRLAGLYESAPDKPSRFYRGLIPYTNAKTKTKDNITTTTFSGKGLENKVVVGDFNPINEFVMNNFLDGIHPTTDGSTALNARYIPKRTRYVEHYIDRYVKTMEQEFTDYFTISLLGQLKTY